MSFFNGYQVANVFRIAKSGAVKIMCCHAGELYNKYRSEFCN